jgi:hypothetical protein
MPLALAHLPFVGTGSRLLLPAPISVCLTEMALAALPLARCDLSLGATFISWTPSILLCESAHLCESINFLVPGPVRWTILYDPLHSPACSAAVDEGAPPSSTAGQSPDTVTTARRLIVRRRCQVVFHYSNLAVDSGQQALMTSAMAVRESHVPLPPAVTTPPQQLTRPFVLANQRDSSAFAAVQP